MVDLIVVKRVNNIDLHYRIKTIISYFYLLFNSHSTSFY